MINVLIVDDNFVRSEKIKKRIELSLPTEYYNINFCDNVSDGVHLMSITHYDLLILDVVLPMRSKSKPSLAEHGLRLLKDIHNNDDLYIPKKIIGITSFKEDMSHFKDKFERYTSLIIEAQIDKSEWIDKIKENIEKLVKTDILINNKNVNKLLITIHGIRTYGDWQEKLEEEIQTKTNSFEFIHFKYGFFGILFFLFPIARNILIRKLFKQFSELMKEHLDKKIYIVSHSFGTYIMLKILEKYKKEINIEVLIFSGSVIKSTYDLSSLIGKKVKCIINDCSDNDLVLLFNKIFVPSLGDAGRIGFVGYNSLSLKNRFLIGGHSVYFSNFNAKDNYMLRYWVPLLVNNNLKNIYERKRPPLYLDILEPILSLWIYIKDFVLWAILIWLIIKLYYIF